MSRLAIGLDIGGANLKLATSGGRAVSRPFELWKHPDRLSAELRDLAGDLPTDAPVGVTMTGELCDCFETKRDGVRHILAAVQAVFGPDRPRVWGTGGRFLTLAEAAEDYMVVAAANWHALATFAGRYVPEGSAVLVDTGSTTTDVVPLYDGKLSQFVTTDTDRLCSMSLVYTGVKRTPICALSLAYTAAEWFATTHDAYVVLGMLPEAPSDVATADGRPMTRQYAHARLARMLGGDGEITPEAETRSFAELVFSEQRGRISESIAYKYATYPMNERPRTFILSGSGEFLARAAMEQFPGERISLSERLGKDVSEAACAYAVAILIAERSSSP